jgi:UDP-4-amino-4,6-dideoxy-N-acetyl-beta-L-altrosamine transaminase
LAPDKTFLPYARQQIDGDDIEAVNSVLRADYLTTGPATEAFEAELANITGAAHAISCSSGTAALHLAALALELGPGDKVIVPTITFLATANAARFVGAEVVFSDVDPATGLMTPENLERVLEREGKSLKAVFPVHLAGQIPDLPAISQIAREQKLAIVEDASHAIGAVYSRGNDDVSAGSCSDSDMTIFSFHPVKTIVMGEGGAVTTNDSALADRAALLRNHGMSRNPDAFVQPDMAFDAAGDANPWYYEMAEIGYNYRVSDIHCALGLSQLGKLARFVDRRRELAACYDELLAPLAPLLKPISRQAGCRPAWHLYTVLIDFDNAGISRADLMRRLRAQDVGSQVHYIPVHRQPYYLDRYGDLELPGADAYYARTLSLPLFTGMTDADVERVVENLTSLL